MRIETLCTGDELLTGLTADTNSRFFQTLLLEVCGLTVRRSTVVGDVKEELVEVLNALAARCDVVLVSGGLGPTSDDVTAESAALAAGVDLVEDAQVMEHIRARFARRGIALTANNRRQALVPRGAEVVLNREGSAPLIIQRRGACVLFFVPGVPREYRHLVEHEVVPRIAALVAPHRREVSRLRLLKTLGLPESHLDAAMAPLAASHPRVTFGYRTHAPENHLKLMARAPTAEEAEAALNAAERDARAVLGDVVFGRDDDTLAGVLGRALVARGFTVAVAESCTGGLVSAACTDVPGASAWFLGGAATYAVHAKTAWAGVPSELVLEHGAVSEPVARAMAMGVAKALGATCGVSVTGFAGPSGGEPGRPVGTVFIAVSTPAGVTCERHHFGGDRNRVRTFAAATALDALRRRLR